MISHPLSHMSQASHTDSDPHQNYDQHLPSFIFLYASQNVAHHSRLITLPHESCHVGHIELSAALLT